VGPMNHVLDRVEITHGKGQMGAEISLGWGNFGVVRPIEKQVRRYCGVRSKINIQSSITARNAMRPFIRILSPLVITGPPNGPVITVLHAVFCRRRLPSVVVCNARGRSAAGPVACTARRASSVTFR